MLKTKVAITKITAFIHTGKGHNLVLSSKPLQLYNVSSSEFLLGSTVRGLCRPEDRSNKINQRF